MRSLITSGHATDKEIDVWLTSLAFIKNPTRDMMTQLKVCIVFVRMNTVLSSKPDYFFAILKAVMFCRPYEALAWCIPGS